MGDSQWSDSFWDLAGCTVVDGRETAVGKTMGSVSNKDSSCVNQFHHWWAGVEQRREGSHTRKQERTVMWWRVLCHGRLCVRDQNLRKAPQEVEDPLSNYCSDRDRDRRTRWTMPSRIGPRQCPPMTMTVFHQVGPAVSDG